MSVWKEIRRVARQRHAEIAGNTDALIPANILIDAAQSVTGVKVKSRPMGDPLLDGSEATYDRHQQRIYYSRSTDKLLANFHIIHEFAHHWLEEVCASCSSADLDPLVPAEPEMTSVGDEDAYSPKERAESQANLFAREFLLPRDKLRRRFLTDNIDADSISAEVGVPVDLVMQQLADALLLPPERERATVEREEEAPDASQLEAITAPDEPRLVRAGPGTGKTRTLVGRIAYLLNRGEEPGSILALTYSNLSAQDLASRIRREVGEKATRIWSGTFHAYGLELLRKYGQLLGFESEPKLFDRTDSLMLLEELLPSLELEHYLELHEPILKLRSILGAIGRAKDDLATPEDYAAHARMMLERARDEKSTETALKASEVARVYAIYQATLEERGCVDFGDLIALPVNILREHTDIRDAVRNEKAHILVDEYQDMNRASGLFLRELSTPGRGPWVVGDVRQSIYRFRGASPLNMTKFSEDFPGARTTDLQVNYRSGGRIVRLFESFGNTMNVGSSASASRLTAYRGETCGEVHYNVAECRDSEWLGVAQAILRRVNSGTAEFGDHAVLGRSHTTLSRLATQLERENVPCLYFGDFFERPEIRDLLSLLSVVSERRGVGLLRVAQFPKYLIPPDDIQKVVNYRRTHKIQMLSALGDLPSVPGLSAEGLAKLELLERDVQDADWIATPHRFLTSYLFRRSVYLKPLLADTSVAGQQKRLAIYQLLQFAFAFRSRKKENPKRAFLAHIRRLELLDEEKQLRQLPAAANDIDAVRLMTVHASKGLEFPIVHIVTLTASQFPLKRQGNICPLPDGLISTDTLMGHDAEEDSLFFVAVSRARDVLHLSRATTNGKVNATCSRLLTPISRHVPTPGPWTSVGVPDATWPRLVGRPANDQWTAYELEAYLECPRKFYYEYVLELGGKDAKSPYLKFQSALRSSMQWLRETPSATERRKGLAVRFKEDWEKFGPCDHAFESIYRRMAETMIDQAQASIGDGTLPTNRQLTLPLSGTVVSCRADDIQRSTNGIVIRRLKTGKLAKEETAKARYALLQAALRVDHPHESIRFEHFSLLTGKSQVTTKSSASLEKELKTMEAAVSAAGDGHFPPVAGSRCPSCEYYFICPSQGAPREQRTLG